MLSQAIVFLVDTLGGLFVGALLLRFLLQAFRASYRNPLSQFLAALTDFIVLPARRVIPGLWGYDLATLVVAWLAQLLLLIVILLLKGYALGGAPGIVLAAAALLAVVELLKTTVYIFMFAVIVQAVLSWIAPHSPVAPLLGALTAPLLRPFRRIMPPVGGVDLTPLFAIIVLQLLLILPIAWLASAVSRLF